MKEGGHFEFPGKNLKRSEQNSKWIEIRQPSPIGRDQFLWVKDRGDVKSDLQDEGHNELRVAKKDVQCRDEIRESHDEQKQRNER